jgi:hypothetical protein
MKTSEYSYRKSGMPATWNEENYAFGNERFTGMLKQAETARMIKALPSMTASKPAKAAWQWVTAVLASIFA